MEATKTRVPWIRLVAEGGAIIVSILLALAVNAGWEKHTDGVQELLELSRLSDELGANLEFFRGDLLFQERIVRSSAEVLAQLQDSDLASSVAMPDSLGLMLLLAPTWDQRSTVLDALIASGRLRLVSDRAVREGIAEWTSALANARENQRRARDFYQHDLLPFLRGSGDISRLLDRRGTVPTNALRTGAPVEWGEWDLGDTPLRNSMELQNLIAEKSLWTLVALRNSERAVTSLESLLEQVRSSAP